jgi:hypothetical protein
MLEGYCTTWEPNGAGGFVPGVPLSVRVGNMLRLHISADVGYEVTFLRLRVQVKVTVDADGTWSFTEAPDFQPAPPGAFRPLGSRPGLPVRYPLPAEPWNGCSWPGFDFLVDDDTVKSGMYAACLSAADGSGDDFYIVFVVRRAGPPADRKLAVLASTNTWNSYNPFGGKSHYVGNPETKTLSFERPSYYTRPVAPFTDPPPAPGEPMRAEPGRTDFNTRHLTRAEVWFLTWLEDHGYPFELFSDSDFHLSRFNPADYAGLVLNTHPEYWTLNMRDRLDVYLGNGGKLLYLGGNGLYERAEFDPADPNMMLIRQGDYPQRWLFRCDSIARPELPVLGVAYEGGVLPDMTPTFMRKVGPYKVHTDTHPFFGGSFASGQAIGKHGMTGTTGTAADGEACGWEMDTSETGDDFHPSPGWDGGCSCDATFGGKPPGHVVLAQSDDKHCQMTYYPTGAGAATGFVLSAGSLIFTGSLVVDPDLQKVTGAALNACFI